MSSLSVTKNVFYNISEEPFLCYINCNIKHPTLGFNCHFKTSNGSKTRIKPTRYKMSNNIAIFDLAHRKPAVALTTHHSNACRVSQSGTPNDIQNSLHPLRELFKGGIISDGKFAVEKSISNACDGLV